ncbi:MAG: DUF86 domain-containing protein [Prolixibacteraceae bacterium]|jgi:uncharacterized protein with HEPN domain|nr:DUF86 domain-containing protein [Prolixibacteraceae bacterium]
MFDKELAYDLVLLICENLEVVQRRTKGIKTYDDFVSTENGMILLDSTCMKLAAVGESIKNLDKITNRELLYLFPNIQWKQVMGMRDIIVHHYFDIDAEVIYKTIKEDLPPLINELYKIKNNLQP